jgi:catechol 2,3-dioxygenase-like lactoylglutathione lyase family enzyme
MATEFLGFDHVDARVTSLRDAEPFYDGLLPELGLTRKNHAYVDAHGEWGDVPDGAAHNVVEYYESKKPGAAARFIGIIEDRHMTPVLTRIAFRIASEAELGTWQERLASMGARNIEPSASPDYPALFFEDPCGTKLELCARRPAV